MKIAIAVLLLAVLGLFVQVRRLARRLEQLGDRLIDLRIHSGRNQEELAAGLRALEGRHPGRPDGEASGAGHPEGERLIQIRSVGRSRD